MYKLFYLHLFSFYFHFRALLYKSDKILFLKEMDIKDLKIQESIINFAEQNKYIFTKWTKFDLNKELQAKISQEVYS